MPIFCVIHAKLNWNLSGIFHNKRRAQRDVFDVIRTKRHFDAKPMKDVVSLGLKPLQKLSFAVDLYIFDHVKAAAFQLHHNIALLGFGQ